MRNKAKKLLCFVAAATMLASTLALTACGGNYSLDKPLANSPVATAEAKSNGGFAVEKGEYVYFINGAEDYTVSNKYGNVVKGSLMRIKKAALSGENADYASAEMVVPMLISPRNTSAGIYIFGDYVYYATPSADKDIGTGEVDNTYVDFKRAKLDGSNTMKDYLFRLSNGSINYRFVEENGKVYCLYEDGGALKSYSVEKDKTTVLVEGAGTYYYNQKDPTDGNVYYTMNVTYDVDSDKATQAAYNQIYCVNAAATYSVNKDSAAYTVKNADGTTYRTYDFDGKYLEDNLDGFERGDYTTYPYVNLGKLVIDGIGRIGTEAEGAPRMTVFNDEKDPAYVQANAQELSGFTYTIKSYEKVKGHENGGIYYTRSDDDSKIYYYDGSAADTVVANTNPVAVPTTTKTVSSELREITEAGEHRYLYVSGNNLYRTNGTEEVMLASGVSGKTLWQTEGDYLYYYGSGSTPVTGASVNGYQLSRIDYTGNKDNYDFILNEFDPANEAYKPVTISYVDFNNSWYMPEILGDVLLYANAQAIGSVSYNYIYATTLDADAIKANNEAYEKTLTYFEDELTSDLKQAATYLFRTYKYNVPEEEQSFFIDWDAVNKEYKANNDGEELSWKDEFEEVYDENVKDSEDGPKKLLTTKDNGYVVESDLINMIGEVKDSDAEDIAEAWKTYLPFDPEDVEEKKELAWWVITLIVVGSVLVVAAAVVVPIVVLRKRKAKAEAEATVNAYKRVKIDTTDDKSIDVYADDETESTNKENE